MNWKYARSRPFLVSLCRLQRGNLRRGITTPCWYRMSCSGSWGLAAALRVAQAGGRGLLTPRLAQLAAKWGPGFFSLAEGSLDVKQPAFGWLVLLQDSLAGNPPVRQGCGWISPIRCQCVDSGVLVGSYSDTTLFYRENCLRTKKLQLRAALHSLIALEDSSVLGWDGPPAPSGPPCPPELGTSMHFAAAG